MFELEELRIKHKPYFEAMLVDKNRTGLEQTKKHTIYKAIKKLGKIAYVREIPTNDVEIECTIEYHHSTYRHRTILLEPIYDYISVSFVGMVWESSRRDWVTGGQCHETIQLHFPSEPIIPLWKKWHMNDCKGGTKTQMAVLYATVADHQWDYDKCKQLLRQQDLLIDDGYRYGSAWLVKVIPEIYLYEIVGAMQS